MVGGNETLMKSVKVVLSMSESVKKFVNITNKYPYDIDLRSGRYLIDAKSLLGIYASIFPNPSCWKYRATTATTCLKNWRRLSRNNQSHRRPRQYNRGCFLCMPVRFSQVAVHLRRAAGS